MIRTITFLFLVLQGFRLFGQPILGLDTIVSGLNQPIHVTNAGDSRIFVCQRPGEIRIVNNGVLVGPNFLDISSRVNTSGEGGLLGLAFHPNFANNGYFYVNYTRNNPGGTYPLVTYISRFTRDPFYPDSANINSELVIDTIHQPFTNHNAGDLQFGSDGYLYVPLGDGGGTGDPNNNSQNMRKKLGKILRYNVDIPAPYVPVDNPYVGGDTIPDHIWAAGLRNPFRFSFDRLNGDMWIGDVGQGALEEVDYIPSGQGATWNFGWRCYEGNLPYNTNNCGPYDNYIAPVRVYDRIYNDTTPDGGKTITGGYVYRGSEYPALEGYYIHADYISNKIWGLKQVEPDSFLNTYFGQLSTGLVGFGEDVSGEIYTVSILNGRLMKIKDKCEAYRPTITQNGSLLIGTSSAPGGSTWQWYFYEDSIVGATSPNYSPQNLGEFTLRLISPNGCTVFSDSFNYLLPQSVFISEYTEGLGNNRCLEIFNGTDTTIDLAAEGYSIDIFFDGSDTAGVNIPLSGIIASGDVFVICDPLAEAEFLAQTDQTSPNLTFTGNDAIQLKKGAVILDVIGQIGFNPGFGWAGSCSSQATQNHTLVRRSNVIVGDSNGLDQFDSTPEWLCFPVNYSADLGLHPAVALPIKLEYARAERKAGDVSIEWKIGANSTAALFEIQRSVDRSEFQTIGQVLPVGANNIDVIYKYLDKQAPLSQIYYRLKMVDEDQTVIFSKIFIIPSINSGILVSEVYPSPSKEFVVLDLETFEPGNLKMECFDLNGRTMFAKDQLMVTGTFQIKESVQDLPDGIYWLRLSTDSQVIVRQIVVNK